VWRGITFQAENAEGGGFDANGAWAAGYGGFKTGCTVDASDCSIISSPKNGMGGRVGKIGPKKGVKFSNVNVALGGTNNLVVYYTNGDAASLNRYLRFKVNGSANQDIAVAGINDWNNPMGVTISLSGFNAGSNNTIYVTADDTHAAPDLDWIEIVNTSTGSSVATTGTCDESKWTESANVNASTAPAGNDANNTTRFTTGRAMAANDYYQVDFTGTVKLSQVVIDNTNSSSTNDFPATFKIVGSTDGTNFSTVLKDNVSGAAGSMTVTFPVSVVRAIRIQIITANSNNNWFSIGELNTACSL
jgi:hypothetical protein